MKQADDDTRVALDVRPVLAAGEEPFSMIMEAASIVPVGGELEITAPFEPIPLYHVLSVRGFGHRTDVQGPDAFVVHFTNTGITAATRVGEVYERHPATAPVLARYNVDLCCGGELTLSVVAQANDVGVEEFVESLQEAALES